MDKSILNTISLLFAGDFIPPESSENLFSEDLQKILRDKDFSIVNLEAPLTNGERKIIKTGNNFKASPDGIQHIKNGYFDAVALSNNHIRDYDSEGVRETITTCKQHNILTVGAGTNVLEAAHPLTVTIKGKRVTFLNYSEREFNSATRNSAGANTFDLIDTIRQLALSKANSDYVIIIFHGGIEYHNLPTNGIVKLFKFFIDLGADCIVSHHTHRYSGVSIYNGKPVYFGLGNFLSLTKGEVDNDWLTGILVKLIMDEKSIDFEIIPIKMSKDFMHVDLLTGNEKKAVLNRIKELSASLEDDLFLENYWDEEYNRTVQEIINLMRSNSKLEYKIRKHLPSGFNSELSEYKLLSLLNMARCESNRLKLVSVLELLYKNKYWNRTA